MRKHTNLYHEIYTAKKPDTSWHRVLVAVTIMITLSFLIYLDNALMIDVMPLIK
jgi:hypothetical protein